MKAVTLTKYKAIDGALFDEQEKCLEYESQLKDANSVEKLMKDKPNDCGFSNGGGYLQYTGNEYKAIHNAAFKVTSKYVDISGCSVEGVNFILSREFHSPPLNHIWYRIWCIDRQYREWDQVYYANNPNEGTQKQLV